MDTVTFQQRLEAGGVSREAADAIVSYVADQKADLVTNQKLELELSKLGGDLRREMAELRGDLREEMAALRGDLRGEMNELRGDLREEMAELRGEMARLRAELDAKFERHRADTTRLVFGTSGFLGLLIVALRFLPG